MKRDERVNRWWPVPLLIGVLLFATALLLSVTDRGRQRETPYRDVKVVMSLDWAGWPAYASENRGPFFSYSGAYEADMHGNEVIDGEKWNFRTIWVQEVECFERLDRKNAEFEAFYRQVRSGDTTIDIRVTSEVKFLIRLQDFDNGVLRDVDTSEILVPPFVLSPGSYHLEASQGEGNGPAGTMAKQQAIDIAEEAARAQRIRVSPYSRGAWRTGRVWWVEFWEGARRGSYHHVGVRVDPTTGDAEVFTMPVRHGLFGYQ